MGLANWVKFYLVQIDKTLGGQDGVLYSEDRRCKPLKHARMLKILREGFVENYIGKVGLDLSILHACELIIRFVGN